MYVPGEGMELVELSIRREATETNGLVNYNLQTVVLSLPLTQFVLFVRKLNLVLETRRM